LHGLSHEASTLGIEVNARTGPDGEPMTTTYRSLLDYRDQAPRDKDKAEPIKCWQFPGGPQESGMSFDEAGNLVVTLGSGEELVLDGQTGELVSGPAKMDRPEAGDNKDVGFEYTGDSKSRSKQSRGTSRVTKGELKDARSEFPLGFWVVDMDPRQCWPRGVAKPETPESE
jgi:hypothetical protein